MMNVTSELQRGSGAIRAATDLAALVRDTVSADVARDVLYIRLSVLGAAMQRPQYRRVLHETLDPIRAAARTRVFDLPNGDIVAVSAPPGQVLQSLRTTLRSTFDAGAESVVIGLHLPDSAAEVLALASESLGMDPRPLAQDVAGAGAPLTSYDVAMAESAIAQADLEAMTVSQDVCRLDSSGDPAEPLWEDRRMAWKNFGEAILPGVHVDLGSALRKRLARLAELRLLAELGRPAAQPGGRRVGLTLTPSTLAAAAFQRFDEALPSGRRRDITLAFRPGDILADPPGFVSARDFALGKGYRLALDDAPASALDVLSPQRLGLEVIRLRWSPELPARVPAALGHLLRASKNIVLVGVDRPAAIAWGWEVGINAFQGSLVDRRRGRG